MKRESDALSYSDSGDIHYQLVSRVFNVRCRSCERESVYSNNQIVDYPFPLAPSTSDRKAASL
ncbi:MAG TPA: hypothetical protein VJX70_02880 [Candidatus Acidoferrum sp.]|nr:hypothetical protein [Candidatus Acidoferrum sp.]